MILLKVWDKDGCLIVEKRAQVFRFVIREEEDP